ncbi:hypothetical protein ACM46_16660 [Chryseobacterium angstadtii]|uniref:Lipoprotein n=1 Tax=Chryseobacterium angstadtii TaxID=558151 RepID=A0A0J7I5J8_9FLAO|nr:hypothetical protein [Chryseobacterium angstadtii]KMQ61622.1 hypothetical protein ACM46_16660 [Chryseobacterium angstadtii]
MIRKISITLLIIILVSAVFQSCSNKKAENFQEILTKKEAQMTAMLIGEKGFESVKLDYLIAHDYTKALYITDQEEKEFNTIIKEIEMADIEGVQKGKETQQAVLNYYKALKDLFLFSRKEIEQEKLMRYSKDDKEIRAAQDRRLELGYEKQELYQKVFKADEKFFTVKKQFEEENNLEWR